MSSAARPLLRRHPEAELRLVQGLFDGGVPGVAFARWAGTRARVRWPPLEQVTTGIELDDFEIEEELRDGSGGWRGGAFREPAGGGLTAELDRHSTKCSDDLVRHGCSDSRVCFTAAYAG